MADWEKQVEKFKRQLLENLLAECTKPQRELFEKCFPDGVPAEKMQTALGLCERTVKKNRATPTHATEERNLE